MTAVASAIMAKPTAIRWIRRSLCDIPWEHAPNRAKVKPPIGTWVASPAGMQSSNPREDVTGLDVPDYTALVIEWNDKDNDKDNDEANVATLTSHEIPLEPARRISTIHKIAAVLGALGALVLAAWGLRRLRAA